MKLSFFILIFLHLKCFSQSDDTICTFAVYGVYGAGSWDSVCNCQPLPSSGEMVTGYFVKVGQRLEITADGLLKGVYGSYTNDVQENKQLVTWVASPNGDITKSTAPKDYTPWFPQFPRHSLVAQIGNGAPFFVGNHYQGIAKSSGFLKVALNNDGSNSNGLNNDTWTIQVESNNPCQFVDRPQVGDVVIYWKNNQIMHSGYVTKVDNCVVTAINCWYQYTVYIPITGDPWQTGKALQNIDPDSTLLTIRFGDWSVYHTPRPYQRKIRTIVVDGSKVPGAPNGRNNVLEAVTDQGKIIGLNHYYLGKWDTGKYLNNCHGYTFDCQDADKEYNYQIAGYANGSLNTLLVWHISQAANDQGTAVKYILRDNGYKQVHAMGVHSSQHFNPAYKVK